MFWGLIMEPERRYTQVVKKSFHISMASLDINSSDTAPSQIMCGYEGRNYLLCTLRKPDIIQCPMDLEFAEGTEVSFVANGKAHIHLTGYVTEPDEGLGLADLEEQEEEEEEVKEIEALKGKRKKGKEVTKDKAAKKAKLTNGSADVEEEESDDLDFEEASGNEEEDSDAEGEDEDDEAEDDDSSDEEIEEEEQPVQKQSKQQKQDKNDAKKKNVEQPKTKQPQTLKGGVTVEDLSEGNGLQAKPGQFVTVYYEGRLKKNNKLFDSTTKGPGFRFRLGGGEVIKAWDTGVAGMKVGGVRKIVCPPNTAYGAKGSPPAIPPNSTLVFTVTLKKIK